MKCELCFNEVSQPPHIYTTWDSKLLTRDCLSPDDVLRQETLGLHDLVVTGTPLWLASPTLLHLLHYLPHPGSHVLVVLFALETSGRRLQLLSESVPPAILGRHVEPLLLPLVIQLGVLFHKLGQPQLGLFCPAVLRDFFLRQPDPLLLLPCSLVLTR